MKKFVFVTFVAQLLFALGAYAVPTTNSSEGHGVLRDLSNLAHKCVIRPFTMDALGHKNLLPLHIICQEIVQTSARQLSMVLDGQNFYAELVESTDSDGGDLDNLIIRNKHGRVIAIRRNVLAFDDVLIALAGGKDDFDQVRQ